MIYARSDESFFNRDDIQQRLSGRLSTDDQDLGSSRHAFLVPASRSPRLAGLFYNPEERVWPGYPIPQKRPPIIPLGVMVSPFLARMHEQEKRRLIHTAGRERQSRLLLVEATSRPRRAGFFNG